MSDLIKDISDKSGVTIFRANIVYRAIFKILKYKLEIGEIIKLPGIGKIEIVNMKAQKRYDPVNNKYMIIRNGRRLKFSASRTFKASINEDMITEYIDK